MTKIPYIEFDIEKIGVLRNLYLSTKKIIEKDLPNINWQSAKQIKMFFSEYFGIKIPNATISTISKHLCHFQENTEDYYLIQGIVEYLRLRYFIKNYLDCILRHHKNGKVYLRLHQEQWVMPNKQPIPNADALQGCMTSKGVIYGC